MLSICREGKKVIKLVLCAAKSFIPSLIFSLRGCIHSQLRRYNAGNNVLKLGVWLLWSEQKHCLFQGLPMTSDPFIYWQTLYEQVVLIHTERRRLISPHGASVGHRSLKWQNHFLTFSFPTKNQSLVFLTNQLVELQSLWLQGDTTVQLCPFFLSKKEIRRGFFLIVFAFPCRRQTSTVKTRK